MPLPPDFHELARKVNNWGRWGDADQRGTLNFITDDVVRRAAATVRHGKRFALGLPLDNNGPQLGAIPGRVNPLRTMVALKTAFTGDPSEVCFSDDVVVMGLQAATHWDALAHVTYDGRLWNGFPLDSIDEGGAHRCGIDNVDTLVSRGVLLDVAAARGVERLEPGYQVTPADLDACGVAVESGDVVLVRTGHMTLLKAGDKRGYGGASPGLTMATSQWFYEHEVAAAATDTMPFEVFPCERDDCLLPVHMLNLVEMGLTQGQNFDLEALAADCAADGVYEFLLDASPLPFTNGLGAPVQPVAVK
ncbi:MAG TPA: cyclase family protein [Acidimicrobiales bacterium]|nr:cyclase family protein [Acidimicrobiales bacterium]